LVLVQLCVQNTEYLVDYRVVLVLVQLCVQSSRQRSSFGTGTTVCTE